MSVSELHGRRPVDGRRRIENAVIVIVSGVWAITHLVALVQPGTVQPSVDYIMGAIVGSIFAVKAWRKTNGASYGGEGKG
jgi:hypothetical protein